MTPLAEPLPPPTTALETVPVELFRRHLGLPVRAEFDERLLELADEARDWYRLNGQPWQSAGQIDVVNIDGGVVSLEHGLKLRSELLASGFARANVRTLIVVAATAGEAVDRRVDELWKGERPDQAMFLNAYAIAVVEHLRSRAAEHLRQIHAARGMAVLPHYSPGYEGWDLADHVELFNIVFGGDTRSTAPICLLASGGLQPAKSIIAVYGITDRSDLTRLHRGFWTQIMSNGHDSTGANPEYAFPAKALKLWREKRLHLAATHDGKIVARFRFDGSTCNNIGMPIAMDYHVTLQRNEAASYQIENCSCQPADGDSGFQLSCEYLDAPDRHLAQVTSYRPLVGTRLSDVLSWQPPTSPAGCLCSQASQDHKWRIVFQTIHSALESHD